MAGDAVVTDQLRLGEPPPTLHSPRVQFLEGLFATWLTRGERAPRKAEREVATYAALAAVDALGEAQRAACEHEWSEWSSTYSQAGSRACLKCGKIQRG